MSDTRRWVPHWWNITDADFVRICPHIKSDKHQQKDRPPQPKEEFRKYFGRNWGGGTLKPKSKIERENLAKALKEQLGTY